MNLSTILVLALLLLGVCAALRSLLRRGAKGCGCGACAGNCQSCKIPPKLTK